jgi:hypothetical protein
MTGQGRADHAGDDDEPERGQCPDVLPDLDEQEQLEDRDADEEEEEAVSGPDQRRPPMRPERQRKYRSVSSVLIAAAT